MIEMGKLDSKLVDIDTLVPSSVGTFGTETNGGKIEETFAVGIGVEIVWKWGHGKVDGGRNFVGSYSWDLIAGNMKIVVQKTVLGR